MLAAKASAGVVVRVLLDGAPVGGLSDQTRWICSRITSADVTSRSGCWFIRSDSANRIHARYAFLHAKFALIDNAQMLMGSENFGARGMPNDDKADGTAGQRGIIALVDAPALVLLARAIFDADIDTFNRDITRWCAGCEDLARLQLHSYRSPQPAAQATPCVLVNGCRARRRSLHYLPRQRITSVALAASSKR